jgi:hypothetical protein
MPRHAPSKLDSGFAARPPLRGSHVAQESGRCRHRLALGAGASTALFSVVSGVLLHPLAYPHPGQVVALYGKTAGFDQTPIAYLNFLDWQRDSQAFSSMAIYRSQDYNFIGVGEADSEASWFLRTFFRRSA